jgi:hypothetical protein
LEVLRTWPHSPHFRRSNFYLTFSVVAFIFRILSIVCFCPRQRLVCSLFRDLLSEKEIWWHYCNTLFKYPTSTPWEFMGTEAQQKFQLEDPLRYYQKRTLSKRKLRKAEVCPNDVSIYCPAKQSRTLFFIFPQIVADFYYPLSSSTVYL